MSPLCLTILYLIITLLPHTIAVETQLTTTYGTWEGAPDSALNQGRVYAMLNWGTEPGKLHLRDWKADNQTVSDQYGTGGTHNPCMPFTLSSDDYIIGYRVWENIDITGLRFYTRKGNAYECIGNDGSDTRSYTVNFNYSTYDFWYLTGWNIWSGAYIDAIQFQFTKSTLTAPPTLQPTAKPINKPTVTPTSELTNYASVNPTQHVYTEDTTKYVTQSPTKSPQVTSTTNMVTEYTQYISKETAMIKENIKVPPRQIYITETYFIVTAGILVIVLSCICCCCIRIYYMMKQNRIKMARIQKLVTIQKEIGTGQRISSVSVLSDLSSASPKSPQSPISPKSPKSSISPKPIHDINDNKNEIIMTVQNDQCVMQYNDLWNPTLKNNQQPQIINASSSDDKRCSSSSSAATSSSSTSDCSDALSTDDGNQDNEGTGTNTECQPSYMDYIQAPAETSPPASASIYQQQQIILIQCIQHHQAISVQSPQLQYIGEERPRLEVQDLNDSKFTFISLPPGNPKHEEYVD